MINRFLLILAGYDAKKTLIAMLVAGGFYYYFIFDDGSKLQTQIDGITTQLSAERQKAVESREALKKRDAAQLERTALGEQFAQVAQQLPTEVSLTEIISGVDEKAQLAGVNILSKEPKPSKQEDILEIIPLQISVEGSYSSIAMFTYQIAKMVRISRIREFQLTPLTGAYKGKVNFSGQLLSYRFVANANKEKGKEKAK